MLQWQRLLRFSLSVGSLILTFNRAAQACRAGQAVVIEVRRYTDWSTQLAILVLSSLLEYLSSEGLYSNAFQ